MINVHVLDLADTSDCCYTGTIKHIFELANALQKHSLLRVHILLDGFDAHFQSFMGQYLALLKTHAYYTGKSFATELIISSYQNETPEGWLIRRCTTRGVQATHQTFQSLLMSSREYLQVFIVPWKVVASEAFQQIARQMCMDTVDADIIVPVTKVTSLIASNPMLHSITYHYQQNTHYEPREKDDCDPHHIEKVIDSDMLNHYVPPKGLDITDELAYLYTALYAEPMVDSGPHVPKAHRDIDS